ncbi:unnamed protein product, partial [Ectocarpus sp. 8 AP-2014]
MQRILMLRGLVLTPEEDIEAWLQFASLCRVKKNYRIAKKVLDAPVGLASGNESYDNDDGLGVGGDLTGELRQQLYQPTRRSLPIKHKLMFAWVKQRKAQNKMGEALNDLSRLAAELSEEENSLKVKCLLKMGNWELSQVAPSKPLPVPVRDRVFTAFKKATELEEDNYKAWHHWAMVNFRVVELAMQEASMSRGGQRFRPGPGRGAGRLYGRQTEQERKVFTERLVSAARGFMRAIMLGKKKWSALVQQLIACMNHKDEVCRKALHKLLMRLGEKHPQALVNPLSVALKSPKEDRKAAAEKLMQHMVLNSNFLVKAREALLVSTELIRVAILWHEQWHEGLEEASRLYHGDHNIPAMLKFVEPLHKELEKGASTAKEDSFQQKAYGKDLSQAWASIKKYQAIMEPGHNPEGARLHGGALNHLNQAWNLYYDVFRKINKHLPQMSVLQLELVSPLLLKSRDLSLAVPGTYRVDNSCVRIHKFLPDVQVIPSKQRPRKITMQGEDGRDYVFLLKGHEDLRQDERVMQLFGQVNALLAKDRRNYSHDLSIQRYAVSPLSHNAGVVGWVPNT